MDDAHLASALREAAALLEGRRASPHLAGAYRQAAQRIERDRLPLRDVHRRGGTHALERLPRIGPGIARAIDQLIRTGRWPMLERLRAASDPEAVLATVPGVGPVLARQIHRRLRVDTLDALERCAHTGRLRGVRGIGPQRAAAIAHALRRLREGTAPREAAQSSLPFQETPPV